MVCFPRLGKAKTEEREEVVEGGGGSEYAARGGLELCLFGELRGICPRQTRCGARRRKQIRGWLSIFRGREHREEGADEVGRW